jgi:hypothetical protein
VGLQQSVALCLGTGSRERPAFLVRDRRAATSTAPLRQHRMGGQGAFLSTVASGVRDSASKRTLCAPASKHTSTAFLTRRTPVRTVRDGCVQKSGYTRVHRPVRHVESALQLESAPTSCFQRVPSRFATGAPGTTATPPWCNHRYPHTTPHHSHPLPSRTEPAASSSRHRSALTAARIGSAALSGGSGTTGYHGPHPRDSIYKFNDTQYKPPQAWCRPFPRTRTPTLNAPRAPSDSGIGSRPLCCLKHRTLTGSTAPCPHTFAASFTQHGCAVAVVRRCVRAAAVQAAPQVHIGDRRLRAAACRICAGAHAPSTVGGLLGHLIALTAHGYCPRITPGAHHIGMYACACRRAMTWTRIIELMMLSGHVAAVMARPREAPPALLPQWPRRAGVRQSPTRGSVVLWQGGSLAA